jgi:hypothetical protein
MRNSNIARVRTLYGLFGGILLVCLGLFFAHIFYAEEEPLVGNLTAFNSRYAFTVTDLRSSAPLYAVEQAIEGMPEGISAHAHVNRFDVDCYTDDEVVGSDPRLHWATALQLFGVVALAAIIVLVVVALITFYRSAKQGRVFPRKCVVLLLAIGLLLVVLSLSVDTQTYLERRLACDLLAGTQWMPQARYTIHFTRIFFGLTIIFLSQIIHIGREMQEEQELTV